MTDRRGPGPRPGAARRGPGSVAWFAPFFNHSGYGEEGRGFVRSLVGRGWPIRACSSSDESQEFLATATAGFLTPLRDTPLVDPVVAVAHIPASTVVPVDGAAATVARTMFETDGLPPGWAARLNTVDEVWVPTAFNVETFRRAGVTVPIHVVPGGVDAGTYRPDVTPLGVMGTRGAVFLSVFEWSHRKAPDVLLRAWAEAFGPDDPVSLVLRTFPRARFDGDTAAAVEALVDAEIATFGGDRARMAPIVVLGRTIAPAEMPRLMAAADVFVGVSRGEGWGRPLLEAMAAGRAVIGTRWSGNLAFMDDGNSLLVDVEHLAEVDARMGLGIYEGQRWAEPSVAHLVELLRRSAGDPALRARLGRQARRDVEGRWTWAHAAHAAEDRLRAVMGRPAAAASPAAAPAVRWQGDFLGDTGFALANRTLCEGLAARGLAVELLLRDSPRQVAQVEHAAVVGRIRRRAPRPAVGSGAVEVRHGWPPDLRPATHGGPLVLLQPWEFGGIPVDWLAPVRTSFDEVWAPTAWVRDCFVRAGCTPSKVFVVPYGVDTDLFHPEGPALPLATDRTTRLLFVGGGIPRKGFDLLLDAYAECFTPEDDVCLVVKLFGADSFYRGKALDERAKAMAADPALPALEVVDRRLTQAEMAALYRAGDVLVHPYRGEGFGLPVAEAMACGLPTVVTGRGACLDFCDETTSWLLPATDRPARATGLAPGAPGYWLAEPDPAALRDALRQAVADTTARKAKGLAARARIVERYTWRHAADAAQARIGALAAGAAGAGAAGAGAAGSHDHRSTQQAEEGTVNQPATATPAADGGLDERLRSLTTLTTAAIGGMQQALSEVLKTVATLEQRVNLLATETSTCPGGNLTIPTELVIAGADGKPVLGFRGTGGDGSYRAFEDVFRGDEATIRERQRCYLPHLLDRGPVLDVGCGRGELLELLRDAGVPGRGVDLDASMVRRAGEKGLDVVRGSALALLRELPDGSLGSVFSAQVIEHLAPEELTAFLEESSRVIRPGGALIAETVNPHCALARKNFWLDLTHQHPVFPEVAVVMCRGAGFSEATVVFPAAGDDDLARNLLTSPDYAVVAVR